MERDRMETDSMLEVKGIRKSFGSLEVLKGVDLTVNRGDVIAIVGPSGSGKTTLLRCMNFLEMADAGTMTFDGQLYRFGHVSRKEAAGLRRRTGFVFQNYNLFANKTALQNVTEGLIVARKIPKSRAEQTGREALDKVGLSDRYDYYPAQLSGGQQQRVAIARALITRPEILLMDEPLCNLDVQLRVEMRTEMAFLFRRLGTTVFHVTHDPSEAFAMADRIVIMNKGNIDQIDTPQNCYRNPKTESVAALLGAGNAVHGTASADGAEAVRLGGVSCMAAGREGICREDPVSIRFRAENAVWRGDQNEGNGFPVTVEYSSFEGDFYRVMAKTVEGEPLCFLSREFLKKGVRGYVAVEKSRLYVYGRECA